MHCKGSEIYWTMQAFRHSDNTYMNLYEVIWTYTKLFAFFSWLSHRFLVSLHLQRCKCDYGLRLSITQASLVLHSPCTIIVLANKKIQFTIMIKNHQSLSTKSQPSMGRMELAQAYFPFIQPRSAWLKFRSLLEDYPELSGFAKQKRRTYLPSEVNIIYQHLGQP